MWQHRLQSGSPTLSHYYPRFQSPCSCHPATRRRSTRALCGRCTPPPASLHPTPPTSAQCHHGWQWPSLQAAHPHTARSGLRRHGAAVLDGCASMRRWMSGQRRGRHTMGCLCWLQTRQWVAVTRTALARHMTGPEHEGGEFIVWLQATFQSLPPSHVRGQSPLPVRMRHHARHAARHRGRR